MHAIILHRKEQRVDALQRTLTSENFKVEKKTIDDQLIAETTVEANLIIIYAGSAANDVEKITAELRLKKMTIPIVVIEENYKIDTARQSYEAGVDAYYSGPFVGRTLANSLKQLVYKKELLKKDRWLKAFDLWLDLECRFVKRGNRFIPLRNKEFSLLEFFVINRGKVLSRHAILEYVWDRNATFGSNTVDVHINRLRRKIDNPFKEKLIHTVHCIGYMFDKLRDNE